MFIIYLLFIFRNATFSEYVIYRAEQFVFSEAICGEEGERSREFIVYPVVTHQLSTRNLIYFIQKVEEKRFLLICWSATDILLIIYYL